MDEVRISKTCRNASWIKACYNNQYSPESFYDVGSEEIQILPQEPVLSNENPANGTTNQPLNPMLSVHCSDWQGDTMTITFRSNASGSWQIVGSNVSVGNGTYSQTSSGMDVYDNWYWWSVNASDVGGNWSNETYHFKTQLAPPPWWNPQWQYRKQIVIDADNVADDLVNFPVLIDVTDLNLSSYAQANGEDIVFTDYSSNQLNHEIELYNNSNGHLIAWVNVTSLSGSEDTNLFMYYGNLGCSDQSNSSGVWDSHYHLVQHLSETSGLHYDSTTFGNDGTCSGGVTQDAVGKVDGADGFDGVDDMINVGSGGSLDDLATVTISAWVNLDTYGEGNNGWIYDKGFTSGKAFYLYGANDGLAFVHGFSGGYGWWHADNILSTGSWYYVVVTFDNGDPGNDPVFYVNANSASISGEQQVLLEARFLMQPLMVLLVMMMLVVILLMVLSMRYVSVTLCVVLNG